MWSTAKIAGLFILLGLSFVSALLPCVTVRCLVEKLGVSSGLKRAISVLNCFAGGVFFATSVLDLLPEARESMEDVFKSRGIDTEFPLTECIMGIGFLFILFLENVAHRCFSSIHTKTQPKAHKERKRKDKQDPVTAVGYHRNTDSSAESSSSGDGVVVVRDFEDSTYQDDISYQNYGATDNHVEPAPKSTWPYEIDPKLTPKAHGYANPTQAVPTEDTRILSGKQTHVGTSAAMQIVQKRSSEDGNLTTLRSLILLAALSLHMIFDGLALGLLEKDADIWQLVLALGIHKALVFFTIGLQLLELLKSVWKTVIAAFIFALVSPLGTLIGELITSDGDDVTRNTVTAILQGFATGTFIFVTFFEILQRELNTGDHDLLKVFATVIGFAVIAIIQLFTHE